MCARVCMHACVCVCARVCETRTGLGVQWLLLWRRPVALGRDIFLGTQTSPPRLTFHLDCGTPLAVEGTPHFPLKARRAPSAVLLSRPIPGLFGTTRTLCSRPALCRLRQGAPGLPPPRHLPSTARRPE